MGRLGWSQALALAAAMFAGSVQAQTVVPGPGDDGFDAELRDKADDYDRFIHAVLTPSIGWGLEAFVEDEDDRALIDAFVASGGTDFEAETGKHVYEVVDAYGEFADLGMFGGVQAAGDAFRYAVLRDGDADEADVDRAREHLLRAMDGMHWYTRVTGTPGVFARGIRRITPEEGEPPLPDEIPETFPLTDEDGNPLPDRDGHTWREDQSGELPFLIWLDDTSKDQFIGYVMALGAVYDVVAEDETFPCDKVLRLEEDTRAIAEQLMIKREVEGGETDLVLMDADGYPTSFHDVSAEEVASGIVLDIAGNPFNAMMALGAMRTFYHITGDEEIGRYYYEELIDERGYMDAAEEFLEVFFTGTTTNFSNVNMAFTSIYGVLRYESDPELAAQVRRVLENNLYAHGKDREPRGLKMSFFDFMVAGFGSGKADALQQAIDDGLQTAREFPAPPHWNVEVINCDEDELASGECTGIDGTPIEPLPESGWKGLVVAKDPVPMRIRPPSNFEWRSDPHRINGGANSRLNPGGDFHAAYWLGRLLKASDGMDNVSPLARPAPGEGSATSRCEATSMTDAGIDGDGSDAGTDAEPEEDDGCGCRVVGAPGPAPHGVGILTVLIAGALVSRRLRRRRP